MINVEWYVYFHDSNAKKIIKWNVFDYDRFSNEVDKFLKEKLDKNQLSEKLKGELMYYFCSKCEYEVILSPWTGIADDIKIDVYNQVMMNWDRFVDYVWQFTE